MISTNPNPRPSTAVDDSSGGLALLIVFTATVLLVTGAVCLIALLGTWWMLAFAFGVSVAMTAVVVLTILFVIDGRTPVIADRDQRSPGQDHRLRGHPQVRSKPATAP